MKCSKKQDKSEVYMRNGLVYLSDQYFINFFKKINKPLEENKKTTKKNKKNIATLKKEKNEVKDLIDDYFKENEPQEDCFLEENKLLNGMSIFFTGYTINQKLVAEKMGVKLPKQKNKMIKLIKKYIKLIF